MPTGQGYGGEFGGQVRFAHNKEPLPPCVRPLTSVSPLCLLPLRLLLPRPSPWPLSQCPFPISTRRTRATARWPATSPHTKTTPSGTGATAPGPSKRVVQCIRARMGNSPRRCGPRAHAILKQPPARAAAVVRRAPPSLPLTVVRRAPPSLPLTASCFLLAANCLLRIACCLLLVACCLLLIACCLLIVANCILLASCCSLLIACFSLLGGCSRGTALLLAARKITASTRTTASGRTATRTPTAAVRILHSKLQNPPSFVLTPGINSPHVMMCDV